VADPASVRFYYLDVIEPVRCLPYEDICSAVGQAARQKASYRTTANPIRTTFNTFVNYEPPHSHKLLSPLFGSDKSPSIGGSKRSEPGLDDQ
jgi:hypothetical protein